MPRFRPLRLALAAALPLVAAAPLTAQAAPPRDVATRFLQAIGTGRWDDAARLLDLAAFEEYLRLFAERAREAQGGRPVPTVEELRRRDPTLPRDVAEWQVRQMREARDRFGDPTPWEFARVRSAAELRRLRPEEAAARWLEARDPRYALRQQLAAMNCPAPADLPAPARRLIGTVADGDSVAYALYREDIQFGGPPTGGDLAVMELRLRRDRWAIQPRGDLLPEVSLGLEPGECPGGGR
jgi:hypothetical protein